MNTISGYILGGFNLHTADNYNSIPGLKLWLDSRERVEQTAGKVSLWGDKSPLITNLSQPRPERQPAFIAPFVDSAYTANSKSMVSASKNYSFLHNGSAFAIYSILKCDLSLLTSSVSLVTTYNTAGQNGIRVLLLGSGGRIYIDVWKDGGVVRSSYLTNISATQSGNVIVIFKHIFKGAGVASNVIVKFGNYTYTGTVANMVYSNSAHDGFTIIANPNPGISFKTGLNLIYDWTGVPSATIDANDAKIMAMLEKDKLIFNNLDV